MAVNFRDDTWQFVKSKVENAIANKTSELTNLGLGYREMLQAQGAIAALKTILNLPQVHETLAATQSRT